jgi:hypothetical protein
MGIATVSVAFGYKASRSEHEAPVPPHFENRLEKSRREFCASILRQRSWF